MVGILLGLFVGLINGLIITYTGIHPFVVTLAMQSICRGAAYLIANGSPVTTTNKEFERSVLDHWVSFHIQLSIW